MKYQLIRKNSKVMFEYKGMLFTQKYNHRFKSISGQWWYIFDGTIKGQQFQYKPEEIKLVFYSTEPNR